MKVIKGSNPNIDKYYFDTEAEWLAFRKDHIGASDASIITGDSKWKLPDGRVKTPYLLWKEKLGLFDMSCDNSATRYGRRMEGPARLVYQEMANDLVEPVCVINRKYPHLMVSLDGFNVTEDNAVEIKNCNKEDHQSAKEGKVPTKYYSQVQMQIMVTELPYIDYFSFHKGEGVIVKVARDDKYVSDLLEKLDTFWKHVENLEEPDHKDDDFIEKGKDWHKMAAILYDIKQKKKEVVEKEKELEENLKELSENKNACSGEFVFARSTSLGRVDYNAIPELLNRDLSEFRQNPITRWSLRRVSN